MSSAFPDVFGGSSGSPGSPFASENYLKRVFGENFLVDYTNDLTERGITDGIELALIEAHDLVLTYLLHRYEEEELRGKTWVILRETRIAGYYLALRRGQQVPEGISQAYLNALEDLESMANDTRRMIPGVPTRHQPGPNVSNFEIDNRFFRNRQRRITSQSTSDHDLARRSIDDRNLNEPMP